MVQGPQSVVVRGYPFKLERSYFRDLDKNIRHEAFADRPAHGARGRETKSANRLRGVPSFSQHMAAFDRAPTDTSSTNRLGEMICLTEEPL